MNHVLVYIRYKANKKIGTPGRAVLCCMKHVLTRKRIEVQQFLSHVLQAVLKTDWHILELRKDPRMRSGIFLNCQFIKYYTLSPKNLDIRH
jgi:hypothetical protein